MNNKKIIYFILIVISGIIVTISTIVIIKKNNNIQDDTNSQNVDIYVDNYKPYEGIEIISYYNTPIVPKGFKKVETETASWELDENNHPKGWNDGLVIEDEKGNQFVWIPVKDIASFKGKEGYYRGSEQEFLSNCYEADYINSTVESKELYESMYKYQGFYIARYEAGIEKEKIMLFTDGSVQPVSKKGKYVWENIRWGSAYGYALDGIQGSDTEDGAVKVARSMYPNVNQLSKYGLPDNLTNDTGVISTLCYGIQWDLIMDFVSNIENPYNNKKYIEDSTNMGYYVSASAQLTGTDSDNIINSVKNIYDLAGNVYEWTMESYKNKYRICRGGMHEMGSVNYSASLRGYEFPNLEYGRGFRVALYIK